jgi:DNA primase small subunit
VPIDASTCENFSPDSVPSVQELIKEIDSWKPDSTADGKKLKDYKKTQLAEHIAAFKQAFLRPLQESTKQEQLQKTLSKPDLSY